MRPGVQQPPVLCVLPELSEALAASGAAVVCAPPGSGKTTRIPLSLDAAPWLRGQKILMLEPRRLAARAAAAFMAQLLGEPVGGRVGYRVRLDSRVSQRTEIEVITEGILTRRLQRDPSLDGVGLLIFDEIHERSLHTDLALALCLDVRHGLRTDLRLLAMSATLDARAVALLLGDAPVIRAEGRHHPVSVEYLDASPARDDLLRTVLAGVRRALQRQAGDILVFLPGTAEIRRAAEQLQIAFRDLGPIVCPLYGDLPLEAQARAILPDPQGRRRVVLATSIAETSLTIEGVGCVVDGGWSRVPRFFPGTGLSRLETVRVSRSSADQRAGRAGRTGPGHCYRLWSETTQSTLSPADTPEILSADLAPLALELAQWGVKGPEQLSWLDPPPAAHYAQARELLERLGALDGRGRITPEGSRMADLALHPRLAHMVLRGSERGQRRIACDLAALLSERDIARAAAVPSCDIEDRIDHLTRWRTEGASALSGSRITPSACAHIDRVSERWSRLLEDHRPEHKDERLSAGELLALAYPDRVGRRRDGPEPDYLLASGRAARLPPGDPLNTADFLVAASLDAGSRTGRIFLGARITLAEIRRVLAERIERVEETGWDEEREMVYARSRELLGKLVLADSPLAQPPAEVLRSGLIQGVRAMGLGCLPWSGAARDWRARVLSLRAWEPEAGWPDVSDEALLGTLEDWLAPHLDGMRRASDLRRLELHGILSGLLDWGQRRRLDDLAPTHLQVPSGSRKRLRYTPGEPPVLAVRLQEMFGLAETPRICGGRIPVMLHLLSPAERPIQVTQDLGGFWGRTYSEVKKELKGRYPKHHWPEDPLAAAASARPRRR